MGGVAVLPAKPLCAAVLGLPHVGKIPVLGGAVLKIAGFLEFQLRAAVF